MLSGRGGPGGLPTCGGWRWGGRRHELLVSLSASATGRLLGRWLITLCLLLLLWWSLLLLLLMLLTLLLVKLHQLFNTESKITHIEQAMPCKLTSKYWQNENLQKQIKLNKRGKKAFQLSLCQVFLSRFICSYDTHTFWQYTLQITDTVQSENIKSLSLTHLVYINATSVEIKTLRVKELKLIFKITFWI